MNECHTEISQSRRRSGGPVHISIAVADFLAEPFVTTVDTDAEVARYYNRALMCRRAQGTPIPTNDIWIAAAAFARAATLLTFDQHFRHVKQLRVELLSG